MSAGTNPFQPHGGCVFMALTPTTSAGKRRQLLIRCLVLALLVAGILSKVAAPKPAFAMPTVPPDFTLNDGPTWMDTGHEIFGSHSLAVAMPGAQAVFHVNPANTDTVHE